MPGSSMATFHQFTAKAFDGREIRLQEFAGIVVLVGNTASECGFAPQYAGLQNL